MEPFAKEVLFPLACKYAKENKLISNKSKVSPDLSVLTDTTYILVDITGDLLARVPLNELKSAADKISETLTSRRGQEIESAELPESEYIDPRESARICKQFFSPSWCKDNYAFPLAINESDQSVTIGICNPSYVPSISSIIRSKLAHKFSRFRYVKIPLTAANSIIAELERPGLEAEHSRVKLNEGSGIDDKIIQKEVERSQSTNSIFTVSTDPLEQVRERNRTSFEEEYEAPNIWSNIYARYQRLSNAEQSALLSLAGGLVLFPFGGIALSLCSLTSVLIARSLCRSKKTTPYLLWWLVFTLAIWGGVRLVANPISRSITGLNAFDDIPKSERKRVCTDALKKKLHDPMSMRISEVSDTPADDPLKDSSQYYVKISYRAKNGFGAYRLGEYRCSFKANGDLESDFNLDD